MKLIPLKTMLFILMHQISNEVSAQKVFTSLDSFLNYASQKSTTLRTGELRLTQAQKSKIAAVAGIVDFNGNFSLNITNNTKLPVSLFPSEAFGGQPGTYREIETGIQYTNNFSQFAEVKVVNVSGWFNLKLAKLNIELTETDNKLNKKSLFENIASVYYNILTLQEQLKSTSTNATAADTLQQIVLRKFELGLAKQQELNDAQVNLINIKETAKQIEYLIEQQYIALKILSDIPESEEIIIRQNLFLKASITKPDINHNQLSLTNLQLKEQSALTYYRQLKYSTLPYLNAFASNSNQQFNNTFSLFDKNTRWINSNYIGLKAVWLIPTANQFQQISKAKYDYLLSKETTLHTYIKSDLEFQQLNIDFDKAKSQMNSNKMIDDLRTDTYYKNLENYKQGLISLEQLLNSYNAMLNSNYNYISSTAGTLLSQSKIFINNQIQ